MNTLQIITVLVFLAEFLVLGTGMLSNASLFKALEKKYPKYYESIGQPKVSGYTEFFPTLGDYGQRLKGAIFAYSLALKGIPKSFPKDADLERLALRVRYLFMVVIIIFVLLVVFGYLAFN